MKLTIFFSAISLLLTSLAVSAMPAQKQHSPDERIAYYQAKIEKSPRLYSAYNLLALAYFDKAKLEHAPIHLTTARDLLNKSLAIQQNMLAYKTFAAINNYTHRFAAAIEWAEKARITEPTDTEITAILVEANLALDEPTKARDLLPATLDKVDDFYIASAMGQWYKTQSDYDNAHQAFLLAAEVAQRFKVNTLYDWAMVNAAGMRIDDGKWQQAIPFLEIVRQRDHNNKDLLLHTAEVHTARGERVKSLAIYQRLLKQDADPSVAHLAYSLAKQLHRPQDAKRYFSLAESGYRQAVDAGEVYTLGALARLYCDENVKLDLAYKLAKRNLEFKRDALAKESFERVKSAQLVSKDK